MYRIYMDTAAKGVYLQTNSTLRAKPSKHCGMLLHNDCKGLPIFGASWETW